MKIDLRLGDCIEILKTLPDNSVDSIVTDPPYHLTSIVKRFGKEGSAPAQYGTDGAFARASKGFMGKEWDGGDIAFRTDVWKECLRVLKPGGHLLSFGGSRTYHRMAVAIEDAGFEVRDQIMWIYGSGFPKSHNIGKAIDKIQGNESKIKGFVPRYPEGTRGEKSTGESSWFGGNGFEEQPGMKPVFEINNEWEGWGTALKPAHEPICMARKPLSEKSIAENVLKHGTGGINIDDCRIGNETITTNGVGSNWQYKSRNGIEQEKQEPHEGRFPANIMFDEEAGKILDEQSGVKQYNKGRKEGNYKGGHRKEYVGTIDNDIEKKVEGQFYSDMGGASRFFYSPKVSKKERGNGNTHPTVKPIALMEYLIKLVTPKGGTVLEPFMGSGSTGIAAKNLGMSFIGVEKEEEYFEIAKQRINGN